jgi:MFS family permease
MRLINFKDNVDEIILHNSFETFALNLVSVFVPIFLLESGRQLNEVFLYYVVYFLAFAAFSLLGHKFIRIGFKKVMLLRPISLIIFLAWLYIIGIYPGTLYYLGIFNGVVSGLYWIFFHSFFASKTDDSNSLGRVGALFSMPKIFSLISPLIGGLIISYLGFNILFLITVVVLLISIIPLLKMNDFSIDTDFNLKNLMNKSLIKYFFGFIAEGVYYAVFTILFPLFVYLYLGAALEVGVLAFFMGLSGVIAPIVVSKACEHKTSLFIKTFAVVEGCIFLFSLFIKTSISSFLLSFIVGILANFWMIPFFSRFYRHSRQNNSNALVEIVTLREFVLSISRAVIFAIMFLFGSFDVIFIINSVSRLLLLFF